MGDDGKITVTMLQRYAVTYIRAKKDLIECQERVTLCTDERYGKLLHESNCRPEDMNDDDWEDLVSYAEHEMKDKQEELALAALLRRLWEDVQVYVKPDDADWKQYDSYVMTESARLTSARAAEKRYAFCLKKMGDARENAAKEKAREVNHGN